jgi:hypothetical protein
LFYTGTMIDMSDTSGGPSAKSPAAPVTTPAPPAPSAAARDKREHLRFDKVFPVRVESILFGELPCIARNVSAGGIFLETPEPLPLGARVRVCFLNPGEDSEIVALGEVKNHYFVNYSDRGVTRSVIGMAVRFTSFENQSDTALRDCLDRLRVLH